MHSTRPWHESLLASVRALGEAAAEYRLAHQAASVAVAAVEPLRRRTHDGSTYVDRPGEAGLPGPSGRELRLPHARALADLDRLHRDQQALLHVRYEQAALLYAHGVMWALAEIRYGRTPEAVVLAADEARDDLPEHLLVTRVDGYHDAGHLAAAEQQLRACYGARCYADNLANLPAPTEAEAQALAVACGTAAGTAEAAYDYGRHVEHALRELLTTALHRQAHAAVPVITTAPDPNYAPVIAFGAFGERTAASTDQETGHGPF